MNDVEQLATILHVDMDAFYASVAEKDNPKLKGKAVVVGAGRRGVVSAANYEARKFGVRSAMSGAIARKKCPHLIFVPPRFERYKEISKNIREIFERYTDKIEPLSMNEAFLDVTGFCSATFIAQSIKNDIKNELNLQDDMVVLANPSDLGGKVNPQIENKLVVFLQNLQFLRRIFADAHKP